MKFRYLTMFLLGCILMMSACSPNVPEQGAGGQAAPVDDAAPERELITLTYWAQDYSQTVFDLSYDRFRELHPHIIVEREMVPLGDILTRLILAFGSGTGAPDVTTVATFSIGQIIYGGGLVDITDRLAPYINYLDSASLANSTVDGRNYGIPLDIGPVGLFVNVTILEEAGFDTSVEALTETFATWDQFVNVARVVKDTTGAYIISHPVEMAGPGLFEILIWQQDRWYADPEGNLTLNSPESIRALELIYTLINEDLVRNASYWTPEWYAGFNDRMVATIPQAVWMGGFLASFVAPDTAGEWRVVPLPAWYPGGVRTSNSGGSSWVMTNQTVDEDASWELMAFYTLDYDQHITAFEGMDQFPALMTTYTSPFFDEPVDFFGGQPVRRLFADLVPYIPYNVFYGQHFHLYSEVMSTAIQSILLAGVDIQEALIAAEHEIITRLGE